MSEFTISWLAYVSYGAPEYEYERKCEYVPKPSERTSSNRWGQTDACVCEMGIEKENEGKSKEEKGREGERRSGERETKRGRKKRWKEREITSR